MKDLIKVGSPLIEDENSIQNNKFGTKNSSDSIYKILNKFSERISKQISEFEDKLGNHFELINSKIREIELKLNHIEQKTSQISANYDKKIIESESNVKRLIDFTFKLEKTIDQMNIQIGLLHERVKILGSNSFYETNILKLSFLTHFKYIDTDNKELKEKKEKEYAGLKTVRVNKKKFDKIKKILSLLLPYLSKRSELMLRLRLKYLKVIKELGMINA